MAISRLLRVWRHRLRSLSDRDRLDSQLGQELTFHFEQLVQEKIAEGMALKEARLAAQRAVGNVPLLQDQCRDQRRVAWLQDLWQDVKYGIRTLRQNPGFTSVAVLSLALGIGANSAILGAIQHALLVDIPLPHADRLIVIRTYPLENPGQTSAASVPDYFAFKAQSNSFEAMGASIADQRDLGSEADGNPAERIRGQGFDPGLFQTLGVQPILGRVFTEAEDQVDHPAPVIVISHRLWQRRFGGDPNILEKQVRLNGTDFAVIGVMPPNFQYPLEVTDYWVPLALNRFQLQGSARFYAVLGRLKTGVGIAQAQAELDSIGAQLARDFPERNRGRGVRAITLREAWYGWMIAPLGTLEAAVALVLLIACANVAGLLLARGAARRSEMAMRVALGAGRGRIIRQLLTESVLLSLIGGALGTFIAWGGLHVLPRMTPPPGGTRVAEIPLDLPILALMALLSLGTGLVFGIGPALACFQLDLAGPLKESSPSAGTPSAHQRLRSSLVTVQIALALMLLVSSGLLMNSFFRLAGHDLNFEPSGLLTFEFRVPEQQYLRSAGLFQGTPYFEVDPAPTPIVERVYNRLREVPGADSVAGISLPPVNSLVLANFAFRIESRAVPENARDVWRAVYFLITPNFFSTMKTPVVRGRSFDEHDVPSSPWVAIINETMARRFWPDEDPIGKRITLNVVSGEQPREIVGVVRDIPTRRVTPDPQPVIYTSYLQQAALYRGPSGNTFGQMTFLLRTSGDPMRLVSAARNAVAEIEPDRPISAVQPMEQYWDGGMLDKWYLALVVGVFAFMATTLAAIGIYGVMAYSVAQRTREIGIRMALGASPSKILALIGGRAAILISSGVVLGLAGSVMLSQLIASQLWGVRPTDPATFAGVSLLLIAAALIACFVPVRRAIRVDPTEALRAE
jgi:putative ABC transport system permease protein